MSVYVKICGLSTGGTVDAAVEAGADAVGFVFAPGSPRTVDAALARSLATPPAVARVGVVRGQPIDAVLALAEAAELTAVQFHGGEPESDLQRAAAAGYDVIRAVSIDELEAAASAPSPAHRLLIDAVEPGAGHAFDARRLNPLALPADWLLAGGLTPENVARLLRDSGAAGADVSSGVESSRGVKDVALIRAFVAAAREASVGA